MAWSRGGTDGAEVEYVGGLGLDLGRGLGAQLRHGEQDFEDFGAGHEGRTPGDGGHDKGLDHDGAAVAQSCLLVRFEERALELDESFIALALELGRHIQTHKGEIASLR